MNWRTKARIQDAVARLPSSVSYAIYYQLQRRMGGLRNVSPVAQMRAGSQIVRTLSAHERTPKGKTFFEVGTGRRINVPLSLWLLGADQVITIDINPYLKSALVREDLRYVAQHPDEVRGVFDGLDLDEQRFAGLVDLASRPWHLDTVLERCAIRYIAPGNATDPPIPPRSVDVHFSNNVFEHIPLDTLREILQTGNRIIKDAGLFIHNIDFSDHFSHSDHSISRINFLQFSEIEWQRIAGNRYMYMNRLQIDDYMQLYPTAGQEIVSIDSKQDPDVCGLLRSGGFTLDGAFRGKTENVLATTEACIVSERSA